MNGEQINQIKDWQDKKDVQQISYPLDDTSKKIISELIPLEATQTETTNGTEMRGTSLLYVNPSTLYTGIAANGFIKFGGNGSDGALSVSSGTTDIDLNNASQVIKNYSSISITGTGAITFSNPNANGTVIIFRCSGAVTITSSATRAIDLRSLGGTGGNGVNGGSQTGGTGNNGNTTLMQTRAGTGGAATAAGQGGLGGTSPFQGLLTTDGGLYSVFYNNIHLGCGAGGGGGGSSGGPANGAGSGGGGASFVNRGADGLTGAAGGVGANGSSGSGGRGAGCILIECNGALNTTGAIDASGGNGGNASGTGQNAGGSGGGGGTIVIIYRTLTANTGTYTVTGGSGGTGTGGGAAKNGVAGGDGAYLVAKYQPQ